MKWIIFTKILVEWKLKVSIERLTSIFSLILYFTSEIKNENQFCIALGERVKCILSANPDIDRRLTFSFQPVS